MKTYHVTVIEWLRPSSRLPALERPRQKPASYGLKILSTNFLTSMTVASTASWSKR